MSLYNNIKLIRWNNLQIRIWGVIYYPSNRTKYLFLSGLQLYKTQHGIDNTKLIYVKNIFEFLGNQRWRDMVFTAFTENKISLDL